MRLKRMTARRALVCASLAAIAWTAGACPTALNVIPTAEVIGAGAYNLQAESVSQSTPLDSESTWSVLSQVGLAESVEVGVDFADFDEASRLNVDAKWQFFADEDRALALAVGALDLTRDPDREYYLAGTAGMTERLSLTAGVLTGDATRGMLGLKYEAGPLTAVQADWVSGADYSTGIGVEKALTPNTTTLLYFVHDDAEGGEDLIGWNVSWENNWR